MRAEFPVAVLVLAISAAGCSEREEHAHGEAAHGRNGHDSHAAPAGGAAATNRIDVPPAVRENLGITFAKVQRRAVAATLRAPGRFELLPSARREYRSPLPGRISVAVKQFQPVKQGDLLVRIDSPEWRRIQHEAVEAEGEIKLAEAKLEVAEAAKVEAEKAIDLQQRRVEQLAEAQVRRAELEATLAELRNRLPRLDAEVRAARVALAEAREHYQSKLTTLSSVVGLPVADLLQPVPPPHPSHIAPNVHPDPPHDHPGATPRWRTIDSLALHAAEAGVVESLAVTDGAWADAHTLALTTVNPQALRFKAVALQSDLGVLRDDLPASIIPPAGGTLAGADPVPAALTVGLAADPEQRTVDLVATPASVPPWARAGVAASLEVVTEQAPGELAIPVAAVVQDGLEPIFFRRDPKNPDQVIRTDADLGVSDGRWVVVNSGVKTGDEVVVEGVYELKLTGAGKPTAGGHFHADGTWHPDGTPEPGEKK